MPEVKDEAQLQEIKDDVQVILKFCENIKVDTKEETVNASEVLKRITAKKKEFEVTRKALVKPLNDHVKNINQMFKDSVGPILVVETDIKNKLLTFRKKEAAELEKKRQEEREKQEAEFKKKQKEDLKNAENRKEKKEIKNQEFEADTKELEQDKSIKTESGTVRTRKVWKFQIINRDDIPREYLKVDEVSIRQAITKNGVREIPGVEIKQEEEIY